MIHFAIFAKYWEPGKVKTRLAKKVGAEAACEAYIRFLQHLVEQFAGVADRRTVVYSPGDAKEQFRAEIRSEWDLAPQAEGDLGARMKEFFASNASEGQKNILIGSDTPNLSVDYINTVAQWLDECDIVLGPSGDGGYYLIAMKDQWPGLFEGVAWSTDRVLPTTIEKAEALGATYRLLPEMKDVDEFADLQRLMAELQDSDSQGDKQLLTELMQLELPLE